MVCFHLLNHPLYSCTCSCILLSTSMKLIRVHELRSNLKDHLDTAASGESVLIERSGLVFQLRLLKDDPTPTRGFSEVPVTPTNQFVPLPPDPDTGYPCCTKAKPCKHWEYDGLNSLWRNILTGKTREVV